MTYDHWLYCSVCVARRLAAPHSNGVKMRVTSRQQCHKEKTLTADTAYNEPQYYGMLYHSTARCALPQYSTVCSTTVQHGVLYHSTAWCALPQYSTVCSTTVQHGVLYHSTARCALPQYSSGHLTTTGHCHTHREEGRGRGLQSVGQAVDGRSYKAGKGRGTYLCPWAWLGQQRGRPFARETNKASYS